MAVNLPLVEVPIVDYGADEDQMVDYRRNGTLRALTSITGVRFVSTQTDAFTLTSLIPIAGTASTCSLESSGNKNLMRLSVTWRTCSIGPL